MSDKIQEAAQNVVDRFHDAEPIATYKAIIALKEALASQPAQDPIVDTEKVEPSARVTDEPMRKWSHSEIMGVMVPSSPRGCDRKEYYKCADVDALASPKQNDADALDARRYRHLRDSNNMHHEDDACVSDASFNTYFDNDLDAVVDEAMRAKEQSK